MYGHESLLAPLVRGNIETLAPLREACSAAEIIDALATGTPPDALLPDHPLLAEVGQPHGAKIFVCYGDRVAIEVSAGEQAEKLVQEGQGLSGSEKREDASDGSVAGQTGTDKTFFTSGNSTCAHLLDIPADQALHMLVRGAVPVLVGMDEQRLLRLALLAPAHEAPQGPDTTAYSSDPRPELPLGTQTISLREWAHYLDDEDTYSALMMTALAQWHTQSRYCSRCAHPLFATHCGWARQCVYCQELEYPRQDPAVIMAVTDDDDRMLLAHNSAWAPRRVSVLAGFVDVGEAPERTVIREVWEEVRIQVDRVKAVGTQPWPFPRSLMLAYQAKVAAGTSTQIQPQPAEIEWAQWYTRAQMRYAVETGEIILPGRNTIAYGLISRWYGAPLPVAS